jgi:molecular chaperone DnaK
MTKDLVDATMTPVRTAMKDAGLEPAQIDKILLVGGSTRIPAVQEAVKGFFNKEPFKGINPDECVALGAAIQGGILSGDVDEMVLLDVTPLSLGLETLGGVMTRMIERNTTIPTSKKQVFSTAADNQTQVEVHILQGERPMASDNRTLGRFFLDGIPPARAGTPQIEVSFDIDANGIVNVAAIDLTTKRKQNITITASSNMSDSDIERAIKEAEEFAEADKERAEKVNVKNEAESKIRATERLLEDEETSKLYEGEDREAVNAALEKLKASHASDDYEAMKADSDALDQVLYKVAEKMSQQAAQQQPPQPDGPAADNEPGTYDADFKDIGSDEG